MSTRLCGPIGANDPDYTSVQLKFGHSHMNESGAIEILECLEKNTHVVLLWFKNIPFTKTLGEAVAKMLRANTTISAINIYYGSLIPGRGLEEIMGALAESTSVKRLDINIFEFKNESMKLVRDMMLVNRSIVRLAMAYNTLRNRGNYEDMAAIIRGTTTDAAAAVAYSGGSQLEELNLSQNYENGVDDFHIITKALADSPRVKRLNASMCGLHVHDIVALSKNMTLTHLNLSENVLEDKVVGKALGKMIASSCVLKVLNLQQTKLGGNMKWIGKALANNMSLKKLLLEKNNVTDADLFYLGEGLRQNTSLKTLVFDDGANYVSRPELARFIFKSTSLAFLGMTIGMFLTNKDVADACRLSPTIVSTEKRNRHVQYAADVLKLNNLSMKKVTFTQLLTQGSRSVATTKRARITLFTPSNIKQMDGW